MGGRSKGRCDRPSGRAYQIGDAAIEALFTQVSKRKARDPPRFKNMYLYHMRPVISIPHIVSSSCTDRLITDCMYFSQTFTPLSIGVHQLTSHPDA